MLSVFGRKPTEWKEGMHIFSSRKNGKYRDPVFGMVTGVDGYRIGINGLAINPVGLKNKVEQGKAGPRSMEILKEPTPANCILGLVYRIEQDNYTAVIDALEDGVRMISPKAYAIFDGWIREELPELINNVLSLPAGEERNLAKRTLKQKMDTLVDKDLRRHVYSVCRSLKILSNQE